MRIFLIFLLISLANSQTFYCNNYNLNRMKKAILNGYNTHPDNVMVYCTHPDQFDYTIKDFHCTKDNIIFLKYAISEEFDIKMSDVQFNCDNHYKKIFQ